MRYLKTREMSSIKKQHLRYIKVNYYFSLIHSPEILSKIVLLVFLYKKIKKGKKF